MTMSDNSFKHGVNIYLSHFTIGLVYEGVKEILYNNQHLKLYPGTLFCLGFASHKVFNNPAPNNEYVEVALDYTYEELSSIRLADISPTNIYKMGNTPASKLSLIGSAQADNHISNIFDRVRYEVCNNTISETKRMATLFQLLSADGSGVILRTLLHNLDERLLLIERVLKDNSSSNCSAEQLAEQVEMSPRCFNRLCVLKFGETPHDLLLKMQLNKARWALQLSDTPIADIANECGFQDASYFTKVFKRYFHLSPRQFRQKMERNMAKTGSY